MKLELCPTPNMLIQWYLIYFIVWFYGGLLSILVHIFHMQASFCPRRSMEGFVWRGEGQVSQFVQSGFREGTEAMFGCFSSSKTQPTATKWIHDFWSRDIVTWSAHRGHGLPGKCPQNRGSCTREGILWDRLQGSAHSFISIPCGKGWDCWDIIEAWDSDAVSFEPSQFVTSSPEQLRAEWFVLVHYAIRGNEPLHFAPKAGFDNQFPTWTGLAVGRCTELLAQQQHSALWY